MDKPIYGIPVGVGGGTTAEQIQVDWEQSDYTKADYIKNKPTILTETDVKEIIAETGGGGEGGTTVISVQADWAQNDSSKSDYIKNKPTVDNAFSTTSTNPVQNKVISQVIKNACLEELAVKMTDYVSIPYSFALGMKQGGYNAFVFDIEQEDGNITPADVPLRKSGEIWVPPTPTSDNSATSKKYVDEGIDGLNDRVVTLESQIADLLYVPIAISSFSHNAGTKEIGSTVTSVTLSWGINKTPTTLTLDGQSVDVNSTSKTISGLSITYANNKTWKLVATDEKNSVEKTTSITFCNGVYYGVGSQENGFDSTFVTGLTKRLQTGKAYDFTVTPNDQYIYYAIPKSRGTVTFKVGGFEGGFEAPEIVSVTNGSNYTEDYHVYRSTNKITGSTSVDVT